MITWKSVGHFFASRFHDCIVAARAIALFNQKVLPAESTIEVLTSYVPVYGPEATLIERLAFAALGEFAALVNLYGTAEAASAKVPSVDAALLADVETLLKNNPQIVQQVAKEFNVK